MTLSDAPQPLVIEYARPAENIDPRWASIARWMIGLTVLSAGCVATCFLTMATNNDAGIVQVVVFAATLWVAIVVGAWLGELGSRNATEVVLDSVAGLGLLIVGAIPVGLMLDLDEGTAGAVILGVGYVMMGATTWRHVLVYRRLAQWAALANSPTLRGFLVSLGYMKLVWEGLWLACCGMTLFVAAMDQSDDLIVFLAFASLIGCGIYGIIWIWMMVVHVLLANVLPRASRR
jgi:hypothetical protein